MHQTSLNNFQLNIDIEYYLEVFKKGSQTLFDGAQLALIKNLKRPIALDFSNGKLEDFHLGQIKEMPLKSINLSYCCNLTSLFFDFLKNIKDLEEIKANNNYWVNDQFLEGLSQILSLKKLPII